MTFLKYTFLFLFTYQSLLAGCGDRVILSDQIPNDEVVRFLRANEASLREAMPGTRYDRIMEMLQDGRVEYYGGGKFVFKDSGMNALTVDEKYFNAIGEVLTDARSSATKTTTASSTTGSTTGTSTTSGSASSSTASSTASASSSTTSGASSTSQATLSNTALTSQSSASSALPKNLSSWAKNQPVQGSRELTNQLNERFLGMAERYNQFPPDQRNIMQSATARRAYEVPVDSDVGRILNTLVDKRAGGRITVQFDTNGTVQVINANGNRRFSPQTFETFLREAVRRVENARAAKS